MDDSRGSGTCQIGTCAALPRSFGVGWLRIMRLSACRTCKSPGRPPVGGQMTTIRASERRLADCVHVGLSCAAVGSSFSNKTIFQ
jgi:hypothetical protein